MVHSQKESQPHANRLDSHVSATSAHYEGDSAIRLSEPHREGSARLTNPTLFAVSTADAPLPRDDVRYRSSSIRRRIRAPATSQVAPFPLRFNRRFRYPSPEARRAFRPSALSGSKRTNP
jgi:hypothetical protein